MRIGSLVRSKEAPDLLGVIMGVFKFSHPTQTIYTVRWLSASFCGRNNVGEYEEDLEMLCK